MPPPQSPSKSCVFFISFLCSFFVIIVVVIFFLSSSRRRAFFGKPRRLLSVNKGHLFPSDGKGLTWGNDDDIERVFGRKLSEVLLGNQRWKTRRSLWDNGCKSSSLLSLLFLFLQVLLLFGWVVILWEDGLSIVFLAMLFHLLSSAFFDGFLSSPFKWCLFKVWMIKTEDVLKGKQRRSDEKKQLSRCSSFHHQSKRSKTDKWVMSQGKWGRGISMDSWVFMASFLWASFNLNFSCVTPFLVMFPISGKAFKLSVKQLKAWQTSLRSSSPRSFHERVMPSI